MPKLLIVGQARWGKDTLAEILHHHFNLHYTSSSYAAAEIFIFARLKEQYGYQTIEECFEDRVHHRAEWHELIKAYNREDRARLAKGILERSDCYVGMRDQAEINACMAQGLFDLIIWVDASQRLPAEGSDSCSIVRSCADVVLDNNGTLAEFKTKVIRFGKFLFPLNAYEKSNI